MNLRDLIRALEDKLAEHGDRPVFLVVGDSETDAFTVDWDPDDSTVILESD